MFNKESERFHTLGPKETIKSGDPAFRIGIVRTTSYTGEQFHIDCPVYADDSRAELHDRVGMCLSVIQERLEEENEAMVEINEREQKTRLREEVIKRNVMKFNKDKKDLEKEAKKAGWKPETLEAKIKDLEERFDTAQKTLEESETVENIKALAGAPKHESAEANH
jgi:hypothetical protein